MKRKSAGIGLGVCLLLWVSANQPNVTPSTGYLFADIFLLGAVVFLVLLCVGPREDRQLIAIDKANRRLAAAEEANNVVDMAKTNRALGLLYSKTGDENAAVGHNALSVVYHNEVGKEVGADLARLAHQRATLGDRVFRRRLRAVLDESGVKALIQTLDQTHPRASRPPGPTPDR